MIRRRTTPRPKALWVQIRDEQDGGSRPARKRRRVSQVSDKRRREGALYRKLAREFLKLNPRCAVHTFWRSEEIHHARGRAGTLLLDRRFWKAVSSKGHEWIHQNMAKARTLGLLCREGEWNSPPRDQETERIRDLLR